MGNRYRSAGFDLFTEAWNYRAVRIEYVSEAGRDESGRRDRTQRLTIDLRDAFGRTHDVRRVDRFIG